MKKAFSFTPNEYISIHKKLFAGIYGHAGKLRDYNITKKEWVLNGATVLYGSASELRVTLTYKMIKEYIEAKYGFKVHTAYIAEVKRDLGLPMYDAPNAVEKLKQPRKHPTPEKVEAIKDALKHFEVI